MMEFAPQENTKEKFLAAIREKMRAEIARAAAHALDIEKDQAFINEYESRLLKYFRTEIEDTEVETMAKRIQRSTAHAKDLVEFRVLLEELGLPEEAVLDNLEHENAHMNVSEQESSHQKNLSYGAILFQEDGQVAAATPMVVMQKHEGTSMIKFLESAIRSTEAPAVYGHRLSESDVAAIEKYREILAEKRFER